MVVSTFYKWRDKYGATESSDIKRLKQREAENRKLKKMYTELSLTSQLLILRQFGTLIIFSY